jgi:quinol-cytochrome oxidoreductase complex cytochrome b subunit
MKDKTAAAKLLLDNGWTLDEVLKVLGEDKEIIISPIPAPYIVPCPVYPRWYWWPDYTYQPTITSGSTSATFILTGEAPVQILGTV